MGEKVTCPSKHVRLLPDLSEKTFGEVFEKATVVCFEKPGMCRARENQQGRLVEHKGKPAYVCECHGRVDKPSTSTPLTYLPPAIAILPSRKKY